MASRGFFSYDPYDDYYYPSPYGYDAFPYYAEPLVTERLRPARRRATARHDGGFSHGFGATEPAARTTARPRPSSGSPKSGPDCFEVEVTGPDSDSPAAAQRKQAPSKEEAAVRVQAAARGLLARRMVREVRAVERQAEAVAARVAAEAEALRADARARIGFGEELMRLLLRLDGVRGAREYRRRVTRRVLALQDAVDALEAMPTVVTADAPEVQDAEKEAENGMEPELELPVEDTTAVDSLAAETTDMAAMEVDAASPVVVDEAGQTETELVAEVEKASEAEGEWEMVATGDGDISTGEEDPALPKVLQQQQEQAQEEKKTVTTDGLDAKKLMEMVATLCKRSVQQCALIGSLAERVDTLERAVRRVKEADRLRRRNKKNKDGKKNTSSFYSD
ncbi:hypothetical protein ACQJBY_056693 [Aegilops geniculata]